MYAICQWGMLVGLARFGNPTMVGRYALALTIIAPMTLLCNFQLRVVQATDIKNRFKFGSFLGLRLLSVILQLLMIGGIVLVGDHPVSTVVVVLMVAVGKMSESVSDILFGLFQRHERMVYIGTSFMLRGVLSVVTLLLVLSATKSLFFAAAAVSGIAFLLLVFFDGGNARKLLKQIDRPEFDGRTDTLDWREIRTLFKEAAPLGIVSMLISSYSAIPRYVLEAGHGEMELGYFAAIAYFIVAGMTVTEALGQSALPRLAHLCCSNHRAFVQLLAKLLGIVALLGLLGIAVASTLGGQILSLVYGSQYAQHAGIFPLTMLAGAFIYLSSVLGVALTATGNLRVQLPLFAVIIVLHSVGAVVLIPHHGLTGAAWSLVIGAFVWLLLIAGAVWLRVVRPPQASSPTCPTSTPA